jgi:tyrosyl-tRNA synthetase
MPDYSLKPDQTVLDVLLDSGLVNSRSDARRLVDQKGVKLDGEVITSASEPFPKPGVLQVGKRHFLRVK